MAIDDTVSGADANSFVDVEEADAYFADHLNASAWTEAGTVSPPTQEPALIQAMIRLQQEEWRWKKADADQALPFPATGQTELDGTVVPVTEIPVFAKRAQMELALALLQDTEMLADGGLDAFESLTVDVVSIKPRQGRSAGALPDHVRRFVRHALVTSSPLNFRILRG